MPVSNDRALIETIRRINEPMVREAEIRNEMQQERRYERECRYLSAAFASCEESAPCGIPEIGWPVLLIKDGRALARRKAFRGAWHKLNCALLRIRQISTPLGRSFQQVSTRIHE